MRLRDHVLLAGLCGAGVGVAEGMAVGVSSRASAVLACAGLLGTAGWMLGLIQAAVWEACRRGWRRLPARRWLATRLDPDRDVPRGPVVMLHAGLLGALSGLSVWVVLLWMVLARLEAVTDADLRHTLVLVAALGSGMFGSAIALGVAVLGRPAFAWLDDRLGLPRPRRATTRFVVFVALPSVLVGYLVLARHGARLGELRLLIYLAMFPALEGLILDLWRTVRRARLRRLSTPGWLVAALLVGFVAAPFVAFELSPERAAAAHRATLSGPTLRWVHRLTDTDGDGASAWLGGGDCAPNDPSIGPFALDIPHNGVDEDCSGADATDDAAAVRPATWRSDDSSEQLAFRRRRYNVLWVVVDAVRADHCSLHGYDRPTTPYLDHLGESSWVFDAAYSQSSATMLSIPSMLSGLRPASITWDEAKGKLQLAADHETLAERLKGQGYRTGAITTRYSINKLPGMFQGFDDVIDTTLDRGPHPWYQRNAAIASTLAIDWLADGGEPDAASPFFLLLYIDDPHEPYARHGEGFPSFGEGEVARYDGEIAFSDRHVGLVLEYLRYPLPILDDTIVIITSDHGEELGEHGGRTHSRTCYRESLHIPLLVRVPGAEPRRVDSPVALIDLAPTILDLLGLEAGAMRFDGASLSVTATGATAERPIFCSVLSQKIDQGSFLRHAVRYRNQTLIRNVVAGTHELYDLATDPGEQSDLLREPGTEIPAQLKALLDASVTGNLLGMRLVD